MLETLIRLSVLIAIFASVLFISQNLMEATWRKRAKVSAVNKRLRMIRTGANREQVIGAFRKNSPSDFADLPSFFAGWLRSLQRNLMAANLPMTLPQLLIAISILFLTVLLALWLSTRAAGFFVSPGTALLLLTLATCAAVGLPLMILAMIAQKRRKRIEQQFPVALDVFVRALRSGHPIASALDLLTKEMEDPIGSEFGLVTDEVSYGAELADALQAMADRWDLEDMRMFVVSLSVQTETGGNLAEILENLSQVIRARASMFMKVRALSSEGRMTGWMLTVLPVFAFVSMFIINPSFYLDVSRDPMFIIGFGGLMIMYIIGFISIRKMVNLKV